jgi:hypothetical protein
MRKIEQAERLNFDSESSVPVSCREHRSSCELLSANGIWSSHWRECPEAFASYLTIGRFYMIQCHWALSKFL